MKRDTWVLLKEIDAPKALTLLLGEAFEGGYWATLHAPSLHLTSPDIRTPVHPPGRIAKAVIDICPCSQRGLTIFGYGSTFLATSPHLRERWIAWGQNAIPHGVLILDSADGWKYTLATSQRTCGFSSNPTGDYLTLRDPLDVEGMALAAFADLPKNELVPRLISSSENLSVPLQEVLNILGILDSSLHQENCRGMRLSLHTKDARPSP